MVDISFLEYGVVDNGYSCGTRTCNKITSKCSRNQWQMKETLEHEHTCTRYVSVTNITH